MSHEDRVKKYQDEVYRPEYDKHVVRKLRFDYPEIPQSMADGDVIRAHRKMFGGDLDDVSYKERIDRAYASDFEPSTESPDPNLIEQAQTFIPQIPHIAAEGAKAMAPFLGAAVGQEMLPKVAGKGLTGGAAMVSKVPGVGQIGLAANTGVKMLGMEQAGRQIEETAAKMPAPNIQALQAKGYSPAQIANVIKGYADVQKSLYEDVQHIGEEGVSAGAEGIANAVTLGMGARTAEGLMHKLAGPVAAKVGAAGLVGKMAGRTAGTAASGLVVGGAYGATQGAVERMAQAKAAGLGADDIYRAAVEGGFQGLREGGAVGAILGGVIGIPIAAVSTGVEATKASNALRKAQVLAHEEEALRINLRKFSDDFRPTEVASRFPEELAAANGDDVALAQSIVSSVWGPEVAATENGMRASSQLFERLSTWRGTRDKLSGSMVDLPPRPLPENITPMPGLETGGPGVPTPEPNVVGQFAPEAGPTPFVPPQGVPPMPGVQAVGAAVPEQVRPLGPVETGGQLPTQALPEQPLVLTNQPIEGAPTPGPQPNLNTPLGPIESGGRVPLPPVPVRSSMIADVPPVLPEKPTLPEAPTLVEREDPLAWVDRARQIAKKYGGDEGLAEFEAIRKAPTRGPGEGYKKGAEPKKEVMPGEVNLPTVAEDAAARFTGFKNVEVAAARDKLELKRLGVPASELKKPGASHDVLQHVNAVADESGLPVEARITATQGPKGGTIPLDKLVPWYESHGYTVQYKGTDFALVRREPSLPAVAERVKGLPPEQARAAAGNVELGQPMTKAPLGVRIGSLLDAQAAAARKRLEGGQLREAFTGSTQMIADHAIILAADMFSKGMRAKGAAEAWMVETWGDAIRPHIDPIYEKAVKRLSRMFKDDATAQKRLNEIIELRDTGAHGKDWYEETAAWARKEFGGTDADMFLRFLASTSADSSTEAGAALAMKAFAQWKMGLPFDGMRGQHMVMMLEQAARGDLNFGGDKINSFYQALAGNKDAVVLDRWMMRAMGLPNRSALTPLDYKLYSRIVRNLAEEANMSPRQLQAAIWEGARVGNLHERWKRGGPKATSKVGSARPLEQILHRTFGGMTPYQWVETNKMNIEKLTKMTAGIKSARTQGGYSFNPKTWEADKTPGYVVTLMSDVVPKKEFYPSALTKFHARIAKVLSTSNHHLNIGAFDLGEYKPGHYSLDLNVVIPSNDPKALARAREIGRMNRQFEIGEIGPDGGYVQGHKTGYNPKKHGPQFVPPKDNAARAEWFRKSVGRAKGLLDQIKFQLEE